MEVINTQYKTCLEMLSTRVKLPSPVDQAQEYIEIYKNYLNKQHFDPYKTHIPELYHIKLPQLISYCKLSLSKKSAQFNALLLAANKYYLRKKFTLGFWKIINICFALLISNRKTIYKHPVFYVPGVSNIIKDIDKGYWYKHIHKFLKNSRNTIPHRIQNKPYCFEGIIYSIDGDIPLDTFIKIMLFHNIGLAGFPLIPNKAHAGCFDQPYLFLLHDFLHWSVWAELWETGIDISTNNVCYQKSAYISLVKKLYNCFTRSSSNKEEKLDIIIIFLMLHELYPISYDADLTWLCSSYKFPPNIAAIKYPKNLIHSERKILINCLNSVAARYVKERAETTFAEYLEQVFEAAIRINNYKFNPAIFNVSLQFLDIQFSETTSMNCKALINLYLTNREDSTIKISKNIILKIKITALKKTDKYIKVNILNKTCKIKEFTFYTHQTFNKFLSIDIIWLLKYAGINFNSNDTNSHIKPFKTAIIEFYNRYKKSFSTSEIINDNVLFGYNFN